MTQVETHNGGGWDAQAEMAYNGLGQRLSMDAAGVIAYYDMDTSTGLSVSGNRPLTAESDGNTTSYLYGLGVIAEETSEWNYALPDGGNTPRQLTDMQGDVTLFVRYNPWGGTLETAGTGNFSIGYLGGILDAATNLIYVGNGQYYDPSTGRFLTRNANPNSPNPYLPFDPTGLLLGPLGLLAVFYAGRRNKKSAPYVVLLIVLVVLPMSVSLACVTGAPAAPTQEPTQPPATETSTSGGSDGGDAPSDPGAANNTPEPPCDDDALTPTPTPTPTPTDPTSLPLPNINDIPDLENFASLQVREKTISQYKSIRKSLYEQNHMYVEADGKIRDDVLVALIIIAELAVIKGLYPNMYPELLEALSNQYDSGRKINFSNPGNMQCYGKCTLTSQIQWLYDMEGIRADSFVRDKVESRRWANYLSDGQSVVNGYVHGKNSSWFWGNVTKDELACYLVVQQVEDPSLYPGRPFFIVHRGRSEKC